MAEDPFLVWKAAIDYDQAAELDRSSSLFKQAAQRFSDLAYVQKKIARAYYEYSTLMDAYSRVQLARSDIGRSDFESALGKLNETCNILRSTVHFGFLAPFISACATAETANMMDDDDPECLQGYKNAIALLEQSKLALSFRDEHHVLITVIDADIRLLMSKALLVESKEEERQGNFEAAKDKVRRSRLLASEFEGFLRKVGVKKQRAFYVPLDDYQRTLTGAFVVSFSEASQLMLLNIGTNPACIHKIGNYDTSDANLQPKASLSFGCNLVGKGKIRVIYTDTQTGRRYNEGCVMAI
jgi:tetratricopeptide (TPR) repeat protein